MSGHRSNYAPGQRGSILLATLLVCLGCAALVLCLGSLISVSLRVALTERAAQSADADSEALLEELRLAAVARWEPQGITRENGAAGNLGYRVDIDPEEPTADVFLQATASLPAAVYDGKAVNARRLSTLVERAWEGLELPPVALVAGSVVLTADRTTPGILPGSGAPGKAVPVATEFVPAECLGELAWTHLTGRWSLDEGTVSWLREGPGRASSVTVQESRTGVPTRPDLALGGGSAEDPLLLALIGGGVIDARNLGDVWGVLVGPEDILLDGTVLHGATFCSGNLVLGAEGCLVFEESVRLWATDHSLYRVRLTPGTRAQEWLGTP